MARLMAGKVPGKKMAISRDGEVSDMIKMSTEMLAYFISIARTDTQESIKKNSFEMIEKILKVKLPKLENDKEYFITKTAKEL
jgi:hypothetical protein